MTTTVLQESVDRTLFVLDSSMEPRGNLVNVTCLAPATSDVKFAYEFLSSNGNNKIYVKNLVELTPKLIDHPPEKNCLLVTKDFYSTKPPEMCLGVKITKLR